MFNEFPMSPLFPFMRLKLPERNRISRILVKFSVNSYAFLEGTAQTPSCSDVPQGFCLLVLAATGDVLKPPKMDHSDCIFLPIRTEHETASVVFGKCSTTS